MEFSRVVDLSNVVAFEPSLRRGLLSWNVYGWSVPDCPLDSFDILSDADSEIAADVLNKLKVLLQKKKTILKTILLFY